MQFANLFLEYEYINPLAAEHELLIQFFNRLNQFYWELNVCLNVKNWKWLISNYTDINHFHFQVVGRGRGQAGKKKIKFDNLAL